MKATLYICLQCFLCLIIFKAYPQTQDKDRFDNAGFYVFIKKGGYSKSTLDLVDGNSSVKFYRFLGNYYIDRDRKNVINYKHVDEGLNKLFPSIQSYGLLCLDIENKHYKDVKKSSDGSVEFQVGSKYLIDLIKYVKSKRPNLKVGIYGLPYSSYWSSQRKFNTSKLDAILKWVDYISPSLYIHYPDRQIGSDGNVKYLKDNLNIALAFGKRLNKPVIPYVWYIVHPSNKRYGKELISGEQMANYTKVIKEYIYQGVRANGVIWWEPATTRFKNPNEQRVLTRSKITKDKILSQYIQLLSKKY